LDEVKLIAIINARESFWGPMSSQEKISSKERRYRVYNILKDQYLGNLKKFQFTFDGKPVCEKAFVLFYGLIQDFSTRLPRPWIFMKDSIIQGFSFNEIKVDKTKDDARSTKTMHAIAYIKYIGEAFSDTCPTNDQIRCIPYESVQQLFNEYKDYCDVDEVNPEKKANYETFRKCMKELDGQFRLIGCKGSFHTCDICNNANDMLRDCRGGNQHRNIILSCKRAHLKQQAAERQYQENNRLEAKNLIDDQPKAAFILCDGMTASRGETPKIGLKRVSKGDVGHQMGNRVIGIIQLI
jgi:hypothetical protein